MKNSIRKIKRTYTVGSRGNFRSVGVVLPPEFGLMVGDVVQYWEVLDREGRTVGGQIKKVEKKALQAQRKVVR